MVDTTLSDAKDRLRRATLSQRDQLGPDARREAGAAVTERLLGLPALAEARCVGAFWPIRSEIDPRPLLKALQARGQATALPVVAEPNLIFRSWAPGDPLVRAGFGLSEPAAEAPEVFPDALLVPLAVFDAAGGRIGYGRGYFDRTIAALRRRGPLLAIGLAYALQEIPAVPVGPHDERLDLIATEAALHRVVSVEAA